MLSILNGNLVLNVNATTLDGYSSDMTKFRIARWRQGQKYHKTNILAPTDRRQMDDYQTWTYEIQRPQKTRIAS